MPKKMYTKTGKSCRVHFELPPEVGAKKVALCGDFNEWNPKAHAMKKKKDGSFYLDVYLPSDSDYRYKFFVDGNRWENDWNAEKYVPNDHGSDDSCISI